MILSGAALALSGEASFLKRDIRILEGRISALGEKLEPCTGETLIDVSGLVALPGAIDSHVHFDDPGFTDREDFLHGTAEAARGGVTTIIDMPCTSIPPVTNRSALDGKRDVIRDKALIDFGLFGGVSGHVVEEALARDMEELAPFVLGYKCYFISGMTTFTAVSHFDFERIAKKACSLERPLLLHAEDANLIARATEYYQKLRGTAQPRWSDYALSRPETAEVVAVSTALALSRGCEANIHIVHVGTAYAAELIARHGATCETCAHYLAFGREDFESLGARLKTAPPVKSRGERNLLWNNLANGNISFVASDHAPSPESEKRDNDPWGSYGGIAGVGTNHHYLYSEGLCSQKLTLSRFLEARSEAAARRFGLEKRKGAIAPGKDADLVLIDPSDTTLVTGKEFLSLGTSTPFEGMRLAGSIEATLLRGRPVYIKAFFRQFTHFMKEFRMEAESPLARKLPGIYSTPGTGRLLTRGYV